MSARRILVQSIDTNLEYDVIGIDLAKDCVSAALLTKDGEIFGIDRLKYEDLIESAKSMSPSTFAMEPCTEMNFLVHELESWGHNCKVISGKNVKNYIDTHFSSQKTDLNDAEALAFLAYDRRLRPIRGKDPEQLKFLSLTTLREQYIKQLRQTLVSLKGICQSWGLNISKGISGKERLIAMVEEFNGFPPELRAELVNMVKHAKVIQKELGVITKTLEKLANQDELCSRVQSVPGIGIICSCRLRATLGEATRFEHSKDLPAYYGLVPRSISTGHNEMKGKLTRRGDRTMRTLMVQAASSVINMANKDYLRSKALTKWIQKKQREKMPWGKTYMCRGSQAFKNH